MQDYEELIKWILGGGAFGAVFKIIELRGKGRVDAVNGFEKLVVVLQKEREELLKEREDNKKYISQIKEERNELREWQKVINQMLQDGKKMRDEQARKH